MTLVIQVKHFLTAAALCQPVCCATDFPSYRVCFLEVRVIIDYLRPIRSVLYFIAVFPFQRFAKIKTVYQRTWLIRICQHPCRLFYLVHR